MDGGDKTGGKRTAAVLFSMCMLMTMPVVPGHSGSGLSSMDQVADETLPSVSCGSEVAGVPLDITGAGRAMPGALTGVMSVLRDISICRTAVLQAPISGTPAIGSGSFLSSGVGLSLSGPMTRASDLEEEQTIWDFANGSKLVTPQETVTGTLSYDPSGQDDRRDWYKLSLDDVDPSGGAPLGVRNVSIVLEDFRDGNGGYSDLFELTIVDGEPSTDYSDLLDIAMRYYDPSAGIIDMGGTHFLFDDMDDSDGWSHRQNWSTDIVSPVPSTGPEDLDGMTEGLTEVGWYYMAISLNFFSKVIRERTAFSVQYSLTVDVSEREDADQGSNTFETAKNNAPAASSRLHSAFDIVDWYRFEGQDTTKLWNMSFTVNRTWGVGNASDQDRIYDTWMYMFVLWAYEGKDGIWDTPDDGWYYNAFAYSYYFTGQGLISNENQTFSFYLRNTWTGSPHREVYIGLYAEPEEIAVEGEAVVGKYLPSWYTFSEYLIVHAIKEEDPFNNAPTLQILSVSSTNPFYGSMGDITDTFTITLVYTDKDNDPPERFTLSIDPWTSKERSFDMVELGKDADDTMFSDGNAYEISLKGDEIGPSDNFRVLMARSNDSKHGSLQTSMSTGDVYLNDTLKVWDDGRVELLSPTVDLEPLLEDDEPISVPLEMHNLGELFDDPERDLRSVQVFNTTLLQWSGDQTSPLVHVNITYRDYDGWYAVIRPLKDAHGSETLRLRASDDHSFVEGNLTVTVLPLNDPPTVLGASVGTRTYPVLGSPSRPVVDLGPDEQFTEDILSTFTIMAQDSDPEPDRTDLSYVFQRSASDRWTNDPVIDQDTGRVSFTPTNDDVKREASKMVFSISDGTDDVDLEMRVKVINANDPPELTIPVHPSQLERTEKFVIGLMGKDIDPDDKLTFRVNVEEALGGEHPSLAEQLPFAGLLEGFDWSMNPMTGEFSLGTDDEDIWRTEDALLTEVTVHLVFSVTDKEGASDTGEVTLVLKREPWIPPAPRFTCTVRDDDIKTPGAQGLHVDLTAEGFDPDLYDPGWTYSWDFGDGSRAAGRTTNHTYSLEGTKTIRLWLVLGDLETERSHFNVTLTKVVVVLPPPPDDGPPILLIITAAAIFLALLLVLAALLVVRLKRQKGPEVNHDINEVLPEVQAPIVQAPAEEGNEVWCPYCGAPVNTAWFLCPSCKGMLQR